ncbi:dTDP-4-dehydrorhamnose 3,5-epimerase [Alkalicoccus luteus]|uniref:dTDP-4-dehydrorhamnose 3,5-epimerase n=1 Tax=Alkalicoccus luteus TaxID=1237094 RepID=A0A969PSZ3_9BACI|nr:dTDP-4-dehydrorhamnose 3,5-epimerase [Alkalicoccus luteus]NJP38788.1 dTDP-4-dehydrorhamnose 3,5-epimerase [Alkalicoccus luteus]
MRISRLNVVDCYEFEPNLFEDNRGYFMEVFRESHLQSLGLDQRFVQENHLYSKFAGTLRGIHYQLPPYEQAKLVRCIRGSIYDVVIDLRRDSPTFLQHAAVELTSDNRKQLYVPAGCGHAFMTLVPDTEVLYKTDAYYAPEHEAGIHWSDHQLNISWPALKPVLSQKDEQLPVFQFARLPGVKGGINDGEKVR